MRRRPVLLTLAIGALVVAACGDDDDAGETSSPPPTITATTDTTIAPATTIPEETVVDGSLVPTSVPASVPEVELPTATPTELVVTELTAGSGPEAADGDMVLVNYVGVRSEDGTEFDNNYGGDPLPFVLGSGGGVIQGWEQGLQGAQDGARLQLDIPADLAYGDQPPPDSGIQPGDALSFVIDVQAVVPAPDPADAPTKADVPVSDEPATELVVDDLTSGDGEALEEGMTAVVHLVAARGDTGKVLESTWTQGQPQPIAVSEGGLLPALVESLPGMKVGGRRAVTIPLADFEENGLADAGLPADTDLVIIVDLFAVL